MAMEEILGYSSVKTVLNQVDLPDYTDHNPPKNQDHKIQFPSISTIQTSFESVYGPQAGRGLALLLGRACFKYSLREFGSELGLTDLAFRLLQLPARLQKGSEVLAALFNGFTDQRVSLEYNEKKISWSIEPCLFCRERQALSPVCMVAVGFLQEAVYWVSAGKYYQVEEKRCLACGDSACTIVIDLTPVS